MTLSRAGIFSSTSVTRLSTGRPPRDFDQATRTFAVELEIPNPRGALPVGVTADIELPVGEMFARKETLDLIRAYYQLGERPRRRLLDLAKSLNGEHEAV